MTTNVEGMIMAAKLKILSPSDKSMVEKIDLVAWDWITGCIENLTVLMIPGKHAIREIFLSLLCSKEKQIVGKRFGEREASVHLS